MRAAVPVASEWEPKPGRAGRDRHLQRRKGQIARPAGPLTAIVQLPSLAAPVHSRFADPRVALPIHGRSKTVIALFVEDLFIGCRIVEVTPFRVTRASDLDIDEDDVDDLMSSIEDELRRRERGLPVRLEVADRASDGVRERLRTAIGLEPHQVQTVAGPLDPSALFSILGRFHLPHLKDDAYSPVSDLRLKSMPSLFDSIKAQDILLHHPYDSFRHVVDFLEQAADDPDVVVIKQTLYRTSGDSPIVRALQRAAESGKEVAALVELKARFDEANNISWARQLVESNVKVVHGLIGLKTHSKMLLVVRNEGGRLVRYAHLATGNYNAKTANLYTDLGLLTANEDLTHDAMLLFNVLTGYAELPEMRRLVVAPFAMRRHVLRHIDREIAHAKAGRPSGIRAKMNALVDGPVIEALYRASQAGVPIQLMVRGICCLRPGIRGVSETIEVRSILDRFLEHARVFCWTNGGDEEVFLASADWMPRNLNRRIEVGFPILDPALKARISEVILPVEWADNAFSWSLEPDGRYRQRTPGDTEPVRAQAAFMEQAKIQGEAGRSSLHPEIQKPQRLSPAVRAAHAQLRRLG